MSDRRFTELQATAILERAAARPEGQALQTVEAAAGGLTLAQLQEIGREVGIDPRAIADAAEREDDRTIMRTIAGLPVGVQHIVRLPRRLTDAEWEQVVVDLRETFDAKGRVTADGSLRQWSNGNLHAFLESDRAGQRLRIRTFKGDALPMMGLGGVAMMVAIGTLASVAITKGSVAGAAAGIGPIAIVGLAMVTVTGARLFRWARRRSEQMAEVAARVLSLSESR